LISHRECRRLSATTLRWRLFDAPQPLFEPLKSFPLGSELGLGRGAALLELEEVLRLVSVDFELQRSDPLLSCLNLGQQGFALPLELRYA
jgi:hypothetical protein